MGGLIFSDQVHTNEGQCGSVAETYRACSYSIDGDYMFGLTVEPIARALEALAGPLQLFHYHRRFSIHAGPAHNPSGCARGETFRRRWKASTAKVLRTTDSGVAEGEEAVDTSTLRVEALYDRLRREASEGCPRTMVRRSPIHNLGLFATRRIVRHDIVVEYVGELVRQTVGDLRDERALEKGKSTYMFRLDDQFIVDAVQAGNASRFMNHSCQPNCCASVVSVDGCPRIAVFALRDINADEEITYDYKLPVESVKIPCHCGAAECRGYLN